MAAAREAENDDFRFFLGELNDDETDVLVHLVNESVSKQVDCTQCGNCCHSLMINVTEAETFKVARQLDLSPEKFKEKYIEESQGGIMIINTIPCHFLANERYSRSEEHTSELQS